MATGGDFFWAPRSDFIALDTLDEVLVDYLEAHNPVTLTLEGRIVNSTQTQSTASGAIVVKAHYATTAIFALVGLASVALF